MITVIDISVVENTDQSSYETESALNELLDLSSSNELYYYNGDNKIEYCDIDNDILDCVQGGINEFYLNGELNSNYDTLAKYARTI